MIDLNDLIREVTVKFGEKRISKKHGTEFMIIPREKRKDILRHLVNTAKILGEEKEFFKKSTVRTIIAKSCFPDPLTSFWDQKKANAAYACVLRELDDILCEQFPLGLIK